MAYNNAPTGYWCYALDYYCYTHDHLPRIGHTQTRNEIFYGTPSDLSHAVPFYAQGYYHGTLEERNLLTTGKVFSDRGRACRMIGYPSYSNQTIKNSYIIKESNGSIKIRHDCYFKHYTDLVSLCNAEVDSRSHDTYKPNKPVNYDEILGPLADPITGRPIQETDSSPEVVDQAAPTDSTHDTVNEPNPNVPNLYDPVPRVTRSRSAQSRAKDIEIQDQAIMALMHKTHAFNNLNTHDSPDPPRPRIPPAPSSSSKSALDPLPPQYSTLKEALNAPDGQEYRKALDTEMERIAHERNTFTICSEGIQLDDVNYKAIKSKFAPRVSRRPDNTLKYKIRLVGCGYSQKYGRDYNKTFAPTAQFKSICTVLHIAAMKNWTILGLDVENAFLEAELDKDIYMFLPEELYRRPDGRRVKVKLNLSLYGLKQAGELWYSLLNKKFMNYNFVRCAHDQCVHTWRDLETGDEVIIVTFVDDIIVTGNNDLILHEIIDKLEKEFRKITKLGEVNKYIGIDLVRDRINKTIKLSQTPYTNDYLSSHKIDRDNIKDTTLAPTVDYRLKGNIDLPPIYDETGKIRFLADRTRPDILSAAGLLGAGASNPHPNHVSGVKHLVKYLNGTGELGLTVGGEDRIDLFGFSDASYISDGDSKSQIAYAFFLNRTSGTISCRSKKDNTVSRSSTEAEIKALDLAVRECLWIRGFLKELGYEQPRPTDIYIDSAPGQDLVEIFKIGSNIGHITNRINFIHQEIQAGTVRVRFVDTKNQMADILTKILPGNEQKYQREYLLSGFNGKDVPFKSLTPKGAIKKRGKPKKKNFTPKTIERKQVRFNNHVTTFEY